MTSGGAEALRAAIRRSLPLIIGLIVLGIVGVNIFKAVQGPQYSANAKVLISTTSLSSIITGTEPSFVDPNRVQQTAIGIAGSPKVYAEAASSTDEAYGDAGELKGATTVTGDSASDLITFSASTADPDTAVGTVNAVARAYLDFRQQVADNQIQDTLDGLESRVNTLPEGSPERTNLEDQISQLEVLQADPGEAQLVEPAESADQTSPSPFRDSILGFSLGLIIALLAVALREAIDTTVRSEANVEDLLAAPVLASVRPMPRRTRMVTYGRHEAAFADTYALLAAQLERRDPSGKATVLAITSALSQEGKTTTAANMAVAAGRRGLRVVLADFDFRKASVADLFRIPHTANGALQVMSGTAALDDVLWSVTLEGRAPRVHLNGGPAPDADSNGDEEAQDSSGGTLHVLPSGGVIPTRKVPQRSRLAVLLRELRERSDLVILDTPPALLTVEVAEISKLIDTVLVVVRSGRVSQRNLRALGRQARTWPAEIAGAVVTDVRTQGEYSYYGSK